MKIIELAKLHQCEYFVKITTCHSTTWPSGTEWATPRGGKNANGFMYCHSGRVEYFDKDDQKILSAGAGDLVYTPSNFEYTVRFFDSNLSVAARTQMLGFRLFDESDSILLAPTVFKVPITHQQRLLAHLDHFSTLTSTGKWIPGILIIRLYSFLTDLSLYIYNNQDKLDALDCIAPALEYIADFENRDFTVANLASLCSVSEVWFRKQFRRATGQSPLDYINTERIKQACALLNNGQESSIASVAYQVGFHDPLYFSKIFKKLVGCTPSDYVKYQSKMKKI